VVFIIALISGFAVLSVGGADDHRKMEQEAQRAGRLFSLAAQEAIVQGRPVGVLFSKGAYGFLIAGREAWEELENKESFRTRILPPEWRLELIRDGKGAPLSMQSAKKSSKDPQVVFYPSGEVIPFQVIFSSGNGESGYRLEVSAAGSIEISSSKEPL
jgi:type II secretory pathway pseudopilin PulG